MASHERRETATTPKLLELPVAEVRQHFSDVVNRVGYGHERVNLTRHRKPVVSIVACDEIEKMEHELQEKKRKLEEVDAILNKYGFSSLEELTRKAAAITDNSEGTV